MADASWLKKAPPAGNSDEDPFAELTRIMGFDPRVPFRPSQAAAANEPDVQPQAAHQQIAAPNVDPGDDDLDLSIDLERELIGALEPEATETGHEEQSQGSYYGFEQRQVGQASGVEEQAVQGFDEQVAEGLEDLTLDQQAYGDWSSDQPGEAETAYAEAAAEPGHEEPETAYMAQPAYTQEEPSGADQIEAAEFDPAEWSTAADDRSPQEPSYDEAQPAGVTYSDVDEADHAADLVAHLDEELVSSFENDLAAEDEDWGLDEPAAYEPENDYAAHQAQQHENRTSARETDEFAHDFDAVMAEVDMDFTSPAGSVEAGFADDDREVEAERPDDLDMDLDATLAHELEVEAAGVDRSAPEPERDFETAEFHSYGEVGDDVSEQPQPSAGFPSDEQVSHEAQPRDGMVPEAPVGNDAGESEIDDAIAELAAMVRGYERPQPSVAAQPPIDEPETHAPVRTSDDAPEIETIDVPEEAVALADDLDIPDVDYADEPAPQFDDLDAELAAAFGEPAVETPSPAPAEINIASDDFEGDRDYEADDAGHTAFEAAPYAVAAGAGAAAAHYAYAGRNGGMQHAHPAAAAHGADDAYDFQVDQDLEDDLALDDDMETPQRPSARRGLMIASVVGGIAVLGAIGAYAFSDGGAIGSGEPVLIQADADPVKVRPENPGGTVVPNQDSRVFDRAAGAPATQPQQQELISNKEEPVDVASRFPEALPEPVDETADIAELTEATPKAEDRIEQAIAADQAEPAEESIAIAPRRVRTMIVKSDGTLVPREDTVEPETVGSTTATGSLTDPTISVPPAGATAELPAPGAPSAENAQPGADDTATAGTSSVPAEVAAPSNGEATASAPAAQASGAERMPDSVPVAPSRPADQPLDIVGEVKPDQVAALQPAASAGSWSMQIASQPTEAAAQESYQNLSRRYASVLDGRTANIVKADIAGKGTFWRVRVPTGSRSEAINLCESYKAAGGNCFVSK